MTMKRRQYEINTPQAINMSLLGKKIRLKGISQKGKNRVRENGDTWMVFAETDRVLFNKDAAGPWLYIAPSGLDQNHRASRWIHAVADIDFEMIVSED